MRKRFKLTRRSSKRNFKRGTRIHKRNSIRRGSIRRGGMRM